MMKAFLILAPFLTLTKAARILFSTMPSSNSHIGSMLPVANALYEAGHEVHFLETTDTKPFSFPKEINHFTVTVPRSKNLDNLNTRIWTDNFKPQGMVAIFKYGDDILQKSLSYGYEEFQTVLNTTWDIIFSDELFSMTSYGLALRNSRKQNTPYIMFSTTVLNVLFSWELALARSFLLTPCVFSYYGDDRAHDPTSFVDRLKVLVESLTVSTSIKYKTEKHYTKGVEMLGVNDFSFKEAWANSAFNFQEEVNFLGYPQPMSSDVVYTGSHCPTAKPLPVDLKNFLEGSGSNGTIYIAFGTNVKWQYAPESAIEIYKLFLSRLQGYRVLFTTDSSKFDAAPENVKIVRWSPQYDVLNHPHTRLMISHCGLKSFKETICTKTPVICLPMFAEQTHNAALGAKLGFARTVGKLDLTPDKLLSVAYDMLTNKKYAEKAAKIHDFYLDRPMNSLNEAVFWTNRALSLKNRKPTFKRKGMYLSSSLYFYAPELFILFLILALLIK